MRMMTSSSALWHPGWVKWLICIKHLWHWPGAHTKDHLYSSHCCRHWECGKASDNVAFSHKIDILLQSVWGEGNSFLNAQKPLTSRQNSLAFHSWKTESYILSYCIWVDLLCLQMVRESLSGQGHLKKYYFWSGLKKQVFLWHCHKLSHYTSFFLPHRVAPPLCLSSSYWSPHSHFCLLFTSQYCLLFPL